MRTAIKITNNITQHFLIEDLLLNPLQNNKQS